MHVVLTIFPTFSHINTQSVARFYEIITVTSDHKKAFDNLYNHKYCYDGMFLIVLLGAHDRIQILSV